jgi:CRP/FNR family transcriptional regulator, dissimilatory nitrate respiration regulator
MKILNHQLLFNILSHSPLFKGIDVTLLQKYMIKIGFKQLIKNKGDVFITAGDACEELMIPVQGSVKAEMVDFSGKTIKIEDIPAPKPLAAAFLFGNQNQFPVNVTALEPTEIFILDKQSVLLLMQMESQFLKNYLNMVCNKAQFLSYKLEFLSFKTIREKLANYLLSNINQETSSVVLDKSQEELADYFGVARQSLLRLLKEFQSNGLIKFKRRNINILDRDGLLIMLKK